MAVKSEVIKAVLNRLRNALGTGESPEGSNSNFIVDWYNKNVDKIGNGPWCEMTDTWAMWTGGAKPLKRGRAYTVYAVEDALNKVNGSSWHWGTKGMRAGDQVYYDWGGEKFSASKVDHTGTVEKINGDGTFYVLEGNIGNKLRRMHRDKKYVVGYVRFDWDRISDPSSIKDSENPMLVVDGILGPKTISKWQDVIGVKVTGKINKEFVKSVQSRLKSKVDHRLEVTGEGIAQDGRRYRTVGALQRYLKSPVDEVISNPKSEVVKALQRRLNKGSF